MLNIFLRLLKRIRLDYHLFTYWPDPVFSAKANEKYWETRKKDRNSKMNPYQRDRFEWILERVSHSNKQFLDIGSGNGEMLIPIQKVGFNIAASDFSPVSQARLRKLGFEVLELDMTCEGQLQSLEKFDYISACEVFEHLQNPENVLSILLKKARQSVFFSVPNTGYYPYRLRLLFGRFPVQWRAHPGEHVRFWTLRDMEWWIDAQGLSSKTEIATYQGWPLLGRICPNLFSSAIIVCVHV